jgi:hypothetical protein
VLLTQLCQGQHATVLQLPAQPAKAAEEEARLPIDPVQEWLSANIKKGRLNAAP